MNPFYFGLQNALFGVHYPPVSGSVRPCGIVLCYPTGQEYLSVHRAFRQLSLNLARAGFHVLRFDYSACGDSAGESDEGDVDQWRADISMAVEQMKERGDVARVALVGVRLGATLGALVEAERRDLAGLVLWEPIVNGREYLQTLIASHRDWLRAVFSKPEQDRKDGRRLEILGFPLTDRMRRGIEGIDLLTLEGRPAADVLIIESDGEGKYGPLSQHLRTLNGHVEYMRIPGPRVWTRGEEIDKAVVPVPILQSIVSWLTRVCS